MVLDTSVIYGVVGQSAEDEVERGRSKLRDGQKGYDLAIDVVPRPQGLRGHAGETRAGT